LRKAWCLSSCSKQHSCNTYLSNTLLHMLRYHTSNKNWAWPLTNHVGTHLTWTLQRYKKQNLGCTFTAQHVGQRSRLVKI
jgi:hypothetical protein